MKPDLRDVSAPTATRKDLHLGRRLLHMASGVTVAVAYGLFFTHSQAIQLLGTIACIAYVVDRIRVAYPEIARRLEKITNFFLRAEERLKESSMIPYVIGILLTLLSFPKPIALVAISILALADPLAAIVGILYGKTHWVKEKTLEGSVTFFSVALLTSFAILLNTTPNPWWTVLAVSFLLSIAITAFEMLPLKLDDNLTIPLFVGFVTWGLALLAGITFA
jgi:dolichol kinase